MQRLILVCLLVSVTMVMVPSIQGDPAPEPLIGGLLGGEGGGLLGGLLGPGGLGDLLLSVACLLSQLGLQIVAEILRGLAFAEVRTLNEICEESAKEGGGGLFGALLDGNLLDGKLVPTALCLVKGLGLQEVNHIVNEAGAEKFFKIKDIVCPDDSPLIEAGTKGSSILSQLMRNSNLDLDEILRQVSCVVEDIKLDALLDTLDKLGFDSKFGLDERFCEDMKTILGK